MSKNNKDFEDFVGAIGGLAVLGLAWLWFTDRAMFYMYIAIIIVVVALAVFVILKIRKHRFDRNYKWFSGRGFLKELQAMHPSEFEVYISDLYRKLGFSAEAVGRSHDGGIDVVATKKGVKHYIQCKRYITSKVGVSEVRDFYGAMAGKLSNGKGIFITTNIFTTEAEHFASDKPIELIDGDRLLKLINSVKMEKKDIPERKEKCPKCGGELVKKNGKFGIFFGCSNYPNCKFTKNITEN